MATVTMTVLPAGTAPVRGTTLLVPGVVSARVPMLSTQPLAVGASRDSSDSTDSRAFALRLRLDWQSARPRPIAPRVKSLSKRIQMVMVGSRGDRSVHLPMQSLGYPCGGFSRTAIHGPNER